MTTESEWLEPEVLPPKSSGGHRRPGGAAPGGMPGRAALLLAGVLVDLLDLVTYGPAGRSFGWLLGALFTYSILGLMRVPQRKRILWSLAAGLYCAVPGSERIPLATLFMFFAPR